MHPDEAQIQAELRGEELRRMAAIPRCRRRPIAVPLTWRAAVGWTLIRAGLRLVDPARPVAGRPVA